MKKTTGLILALALALPLAGCFQHTFTVGTGAPDGEIVYKAWHHHWVFGLIQPKYQDNVLVSKVCPSGNATIFKETTFLNGLIDVLIGAIYSPTTVTITCDDGAQSTVELSAEDVAEIVTDPLFMEIVEDRAPERLAEVRVAFAGEKIATSGAALALAP